MLKFNGMPCRLREIHKCSEERSIICYPTPALYPRGTGNHRLNKRAGELFDLVIENPGKPIPEEHLSRLLTVFIGWIRPDNEKEKAAASPCDCEVNRGSTSRKSAGGIGVHSTRFILSVPRLEKMIPDTSAGNKDLNDKDVISLSCSKRSHSI